MRTIAHERIRNLQRVATSSFDGATCRAPQQVAAGGMAATLASPAAFTVQVDWNASGLVRPRLWVSGPFPVACHPKLTGQGCRGCVCIMNTSLTQSALCIQVSIPWEYPERTPLQFSLSSLPPTSYSAQVLKRALGVTLRQKVSAEAVSRGVEQATCEDAGGLGVVHVVGGVAADEADCGSWGWRWRGGWWQDDGNLGGDVRGEERWQERWREMVDVEDLFPLGGVGGRGLKQSAPGIVWHSAGAGGGALSLASLIRCWVGACENSMS